MLTYQPNYVGDCTFHQYYTMMFVPVRALRLNAEKIEFESRFKLKTGRIDITSKIPYSIENKKL